MEQTEIAREQGAPAASILAEQAWEGKVRKVFRSESTRLNSSHKTESRMPSSA